MKALTTTLAAAAVLVLVLTSTCSATATPPPLPTETLVTAHTAPPTTTAACETTNTCGEDCVCYYAVVDVPQESWDCLVHRYDTRGLYGDVGLLTNLPHHLPPAAVSARVHADSEDAGSSSYTGAPEYNTTGAALRALGLDYVVVPVNTNDGALYVVSGHHTSCAESYTRVNLHAPKEGDVGVEDVSGDGAVGGEISPNNNNNNNNNNNECTPHLDGGAPSGGVSVLADWASASPSPFNHVHYWSLVQTASFDSLEATLPRDTMRIRVPRSSVLPPAARSDAAPPLPSLSGSETNDNNNNHNPSGYSYSPSHSSSLHGDARVRAVVALVSQTNLKNSVTSLSTEFHTRLATSPSAAGAQQWVEGAFSAISGLQVSLTFFKDGYSGNVAAILPGRATPSSIVVVGCHYDDRATFLNSSEELAPGADDDASGVAAVVETARVMAQLASVSGGFANTVHFVAFSGEEEGLFGSEAYAANLKGQGADVVAMFNVDMIGYQIPGTPRKMGLKDKSVTPWLVEDVARIASIYVPKLPVGLSPSCCSDYMSFFDVGYPAVGLFESIYTASDNPNYHSSTDTVDTLDFTLVQMITQTLAASAATYAVPLGDAPHITSIEPTFPTVTETPLTTDNVPPSPTMPSLVV